MNGKLTDADTEHRAQIRTMASITTVATRWPPSPLRTLPSRIYAAPIPSPCSSLPGHRAQTMTTPRKAVQQTSLGTQRESRLVHLQPARQYRLTDHRMHVQPE